MEKRIAVLIGNIFQMDLEKWPMEEITPENIPDWNPYSHHSLVAEIERELSLSFSIEEVGIMYEGLESIMEILEKYRP